MGQPLSKNFPEDNREVYMDYIVHMHNIWPHLNLAKSRIPCQHLRKPLAGKVHTTKIKN